jgi:hypothetical protein
MSYVDNNSLRYTDPTGHRACDNVDAAGNCITAPGGGGMGFGGLPSKPKNPGNGAGNRAGGDTGGAVNYCITYSRTCDLPVSDPDAASGGGGANFSLIPEATPATMINLRPDYYIGSLFVPVYPPLPLFGIDISVVKDAYGNWYGNLGVGLSWGPSVSGGSGWLLGPDNDHEYVVEDFLQGHSFNVSGGAGLGLGVNNVNPSYIQSENEGSGIENIALEALITSPGLTGIFSFGWLIYDHGDDTPWIFQGDK